MDERLIVRAPNQRDSRRHARQGFSGTEGVQVLGERRRGSVEVVRHPEGAIEIKLSGLVGALEGRARRWRVATLAVLVGLVVAVSLGIAVSALRWDYQRGRDLHVLRADLALAQTRARCWEALARHAPKSPEDVIPNARRSEWVRQCVATEMERLSPRRRG